MTSAALEEFRAAMCSEHVEEAAALRDRCRQLAAQRDLPWTELAPFEDRFEAHLDALMVAGPAGRAACQECAAGSDPGEWFVALSVLGRCSDICQLAAWLRTLESSEDPRRFEATAALAVELPVGADDALADALEPAGAPLVALVAAIAGLRRFPLTKGIGRLLSSTVPSDLIIGLALAGVMPHFDGMSRVRAAYGHPDEAVRLAALLAGLRRHDRVALEVVRLERLPPRLLPLRGVSGDHRTTSKLLATLQDTPTGEVALALGLLGDFAAVGPLMNCLSDDALGDDAAEALFVITGVAPMEEAREFETVQEDELFENELKRWREEGMPPQAAGGLPYGRSFRRLSHDPDQWAAALRQVGGRFVSECRYRFGHRCDLATMLKSALVPAAPKRYRRWFLEEPAVRHGADVATATFLPVWHQQCALKAALQRQREATSHAEAGQWFIAGRAP